MITKEFLKSAREVINKKLQEAAKELNISVEPIHTIHFGSNDFHFKVRFIGDAKLVSDEDIKAKQEKASFNLTCSGYKLNQEIESLSGKKGIVKNITCRGTLIVEMNGKMYKIKPEFIKSK